MQVPITVIQGADRMNATMLAEHVRTQGFVVFTSSPAHQQVLAFHVADLLEQDGIGVARTEAPGQAGWAMCVVDQGRASLAAVREAAREALGTRRL